MNEKLGVGDILTAGITFAGKRFLTVLRVLWAPMVLLFLLWGAAILGLFAGDFASFEAMSEDEIAQLVFAKIFTPGTLAAFIALGLVSTFLYAGAMASLFRLVGADEEPKGVFFVRFDGPSVRTGVAMILYNLIIYAIYGVAFLVALQMVGELPAFSGFFEGEPDPEDILPYLQLGGLTFLFALLPAIYFGVKLSPMLPGTAVENRIFLFNSFRLTTGYFWAAFGAFAAMMLTIVGISIMVELGSAVIRILGQTFGVIGGPGALAVGAVIAETMVIIVSFVFQFFAAGFQIAVTSLVYRRLSEIKDGAAPAPDA